MTTEVCDGFPSDVENDTIASEYFCLSKARIIAIEE
jgi:hypothetical protein